ncbi:MAG: YdbL family protein [Pseudomonadota bacterium]
MKAKILVVLLSLFMAFNGAIAANLNTAKSNGQVGETPSGYLEPVGSQAGDISALVKRVNDQRRAKYKSIAKKNGTSLKAVEAIAGKKAIDKTRKGHYVKIGGSWKKK